MNEVDKFISFFNRRVETAKQAQLRFVTCKSVNWEERTMTATGVHDDVDYLDVQLGFGYVDIKPKKDTVCLIGILEGNEALAFLINAEDVELAEVNAEQINFNGAQNGGLCNTPELKTQLEKMTSRIDGIIDALTNAQTGAQDGGAMFKGQVVAMLQTLVNKEDFSQIENENIKH